MTETKVLHEWKWKFAGSDLAQYQMRTQLGETDENDYPTYYMRVDKGGEGWGRWMYVGSGYSLALELARLSARVQELEAQLRLANVDCFNTEAEIQRLREMLLGVARYNHKAIEGILEAKP